MDLKRQAAKFREVRWKLGFALGRLGGRIAVLLRLRPKRPSEMNKREIDEFRTRHLGDFFAIPIDGEFCFARFARGGKLACYDLHSPTILPLDEIEKAPVMFTVAFDKDVVESGRWKIIGNRPLKGQVAEPVKYFREDPITGLVDIYVEGRFQPYGGEDLSRLEPVTGWGIRGIETRLRNYLKGVPDPATEHAKYYTGNAFWRKRMGVPRA